MIGEQQRRRRLWLSLLLLCVLPSAAQATLDDSCVISILNRSARVRADGSFALPNVPGNFSQVRARATCVRDGGTVSGQSAVFALGGPGEPIRVPEVEFATVEPIPATLELTATPSGAVPPGTVVQLTATARYPDGSTRDVTAGATGTSYTSSAGATAAVSANGVVTTLRSGVVILSATNDGALGLVRLRVVASGDTDGDGIPDDEELAAGLDPNDPVDALEDPDRDGLTSHQEVLDYGTAFDRADTDDDGIQDGEEVVPGVDGFITEPLAPDTDGDCVPDGPEVAVGTNPTLASSVNLAAVLTSFDVTPDPLRLTINSVVGEASQRLSVRGRLTNGKTIDLTRGCGTTYASSDLLFCNFGAEEGRVFGTVDDTGAGACTVTVTNAGVQDTVDVTIQTFTPTAVAGLTLTGTPNSVDVSGSHAYVASGSAGLHVVDVSDRANPVVVATYNSPGNALDVKASGALVYLADGTAGVQVVDVAAPESPVLVTTVDTVGEAQDLALKENFLLVADGFAGIKVVDVSDPVAPTVAASLATGGVAVGVGLVEQSDLAVVALGSGGVRVVDLTDPLSPVLLGGVGMPAARDAVGRLDYAFVADVAQGFTTVRLTNPGAPNATVPLPRATTGLLNDLALHGNLAFGADIFFFNGVPIIDVSDPANPIARAILDFRAFGDENGTGIAVDGTHVFLTAPPKLYIGQYLQLEDVGGILPSVEITSPSSGLEVIEGSTIAVTVSASDDVAVTSVELLVNGEVVESDLGEPYRFVLEVPFVVGDLTLVARATDPGGNQTSSDPVVIRVAADLLTTVVGRVIDDADIGVAGATVEVPGALPGLTGGDGTFSIPGVRTSVESIRVTATASIEGEPLIGLSPAFAPVRGGVTDVGEIALGTVDALDRDGDGMPDACEIAYGLSIDDPRDAILDPDGDGLINATECAVGSDPRLWDTDGDGLSDAVEVQKGTNPISQDTDSDCLRDNVEIETNPLLADTDADGLPDGAEESLGFDPLIDDGPFDVVIDNEVVEVCGPVAVESVTIVNGGTLTVPSATLASVATLGLTVAGTVYVDATSAIDVSRRGYLGGRTLGNAPGGGSYGGLGSGAASPAYGDYRDPNEHGSGGLGSGGHPGGGLLRLSADTLQLDGALRANGGSGGFPNGASGGGIRLDVGTLSGAGVIEANGGDAGTANCCSSGWEGGGGGRVAVYYDDAAAFDLTRVVAYSGRVQLRGGHNGYTMGAGTVYLSDRSGEAGTLVVDATVGASGHTTLLPASGQDQLVVRDGAVVRGGVHEFAAVEVRGATLFVEELSVSGSLNLIGGATLTHPDATLTAESRLVVSAGAAMIDATSAIDVSRRGYQGGRTLGNAPGGGSYGGLGSGAASPVYGDYRNPNELGSGGLGSGGHPGGGLLRLSADTLQLDGTLRANGGSGGFPNGASGGGIRLDVGTLSGAGVIEANGGDAGTANCCTSGWEGGGGGRVAVYYDDATAFDLTRVVAYSGRVQLRGGHNGYTMGAGTVYLSDRAAEAGALVVDATVGANGQTTLPPASGPDQLVVRDGAVVVGGVHEFASVEVRGATLFVEELSVGGGLSLVEGGILTHPDATLTAESRLAVSAGAVTIDATSAIDVSRRGYRGGRTLGNAPGGGSYGGLGSGAATSVYGDYRNPNELGSGGFGSGGHPGGGLLRLSVDTLQLDGALRANGGSGGFPNGASGGGIRIDVGTLSGTGVIEANGGDAGTANCCTSGWEGGGGGRVAVYYDDATAFDLTRIVAYPGAVQFRGGGGTFPMGAGTIYLLRQSQVFGDLRIIARPASAVRATPLRSIGSAPSTLVEANKLTNTGANYPVPNAVPGALGLVGLELNPNTSQGQTFTIVDNTSTELFTHEVDGDMTFVASSGNNASGVYSFDTLTVGNGAMLTTSDACVVYGALNAPPGAVQCANP